ncbi:MAG: pilus assembly protein PilM [Planctomycetota bacterium]|nr:pilus assembly protein PilM [Planctomycetota bacterium]
MIGKTRKDVVWGVEFGGSTVRLVRVTRVGSGYRADRYAEAPLDERWVRAPNVATAVGLMNTEKIGDAVVACVRDDLILYHTLSLPQAEPGAMEKMVAGQLEVLIPTHVGHFVTGWVEFPDPYKVGFQRVLICAAKREAMAGPIEGCKRLGREADGVVPSMLALATTWTWLRDETDRVGSQPAARTTVLLDIGARCTSLAVMQDGRVLQCGVIDLGGDYWTERIAEQFSISCPEAERRKLDYVEEPSAGDTDHVMSSNITKDVLADWSRQLREVYEHCVAGMPHEIRPDRCIMFGRSSRLPGLPSLVSSVLGLQAQPANVPKRLSLADGVDFDRSATAIGAALCAMEADSDVVNLLPETEYKPASSRQLKWRWVAVVAWLLAGALTLYGLDRSKANRLSDTFRDVHTETRRRGGIVRQLAIGRYLELGEPTPLEVLDRISETIPPKALLTTWSYNRSGEVVIGGTVPNEKEFLAMLKRLCKVGDLEWKSGRPDKGKFRFDIHLKMGRILETTCTQPATKPTSEPSTKPTGKPKSKPAAAGDEPGGRPAETQTTGIRKGGKL